MRRDPESAPLAGTLNSCGPLEATTTKRVGKRGHLMTARVHVHGGPVASLNLLTSTSFM